MTEIRMSTPCIGDCRQVSEVCIGCGRTVKQIAEWTMMSEPERLQVMEDLKEWRADAPRQYYYRVWECCAESPDSDDCICWHDEGTGPLANNMYGGEPKVWRTSNLSSRTRQAVAWLFSDEAKDLSVREAREYLMKRWGKRVDDELRGHLLK